MDHDLVRLTRRLVLARSEQLRPRRWRPPADIYRSRSGWLIKLELAGVDPEAVQIQVRDRLLVVRGRRRDWPPGEGHACQCMEIAYSEFSRTFELPVDLEAARIDLEAHHGIVLLNVVTEGKPS
jgi:HSP20 family protein